MWNKFNNWHPLPRYGLAAAIMDWRRRTGNRKSVPKLESNELAELAHHSLTQVQYGLLLEARAKGAIADTVTYQPFSDINRLAPGSNSGQNTANGFFIAPHILTSNKPAGIVKELKALQKALRGKLKTNYELKRSFSPQSAQINAGNKQIGDLKDRLLVAAFTAVGTATKHKAAAWDYSQDPKSRKNIGLIPDISFYLPREDRYPLLDYLTMLDRIQDNLGDAYEGKYDPDKKKYLGRPRIYRGNFRNALNNVNFGILQLLAAFSGLIERNETGSPEEVRALVADLANRPIMIIGYDFNGQQQFNTHLIELTANGLLYRALNEVWKIDLVGVEDKKSKDGSRKLINLKRNLDRWLRRFDAPTFRGFLSVRAHYPTIFQPLIHKHFIMQKISEEIVDSAMAMGKSLNYAAYKAAEDKFANDEGVTERSVREYKARVLSSLEGNIRSAKGGNQLLSQVSTIIGRMTSSDLSPDSVSFMRAVTTGEVDFKDAQNLLIAFMRLNQKRKTVDDGNDLESTAPELVAPQLNLD